MEKYRETIKSRTDDPIMENEIRITTAGRIGSYIAYAQTLFASGKNEIVLRAMGGAINKTVSVAELVKRRIPGLHQITKIDSSEIVSVWEPLEEGLDPVQTSRHVSSIAITLSNKPLDSKNPGYQAPSPVDQAQQQSQQPIQGGQPMQSFRGRGTRGRGFRGGRGGRGRGGYIPSADYQQQQQQQQQAPLQSQSLPIQQRTFRGPAIPRQQNFQQAPQQQQQQQPQQQQGDYQQQGFGGYRGRGTRGRGFRGGSRGGFRGGRGGYIQSTNTFQQQQQAPQQGGFQQPQQQAPIQSGYRGRGTRGGFRGGRGRGTYQTTNQ